MSTATSSVSSQASKARLILQDPLAFDKASQPILRSSFELTPTSVPTIERENARQLWESMSLEPEVAQERQAERKRLLARADSLMRESTAAKAETAALRAQLDAAQNNRLHHPWVYAGAATLLGVGALWLIERRRRILLETEQNPSSTAGQNLPPSINEPLNHSAESPDSVYSLEDSPDLAKDFAADLSGHSQTQTRKREHAASIESVEPTPAWAQAKSPQLPSEDELLVLLQAQQKSSLYVRFKSRWLGLFQSKSRRELEISSLISDDSANTLAMSRQDLTTLPHPDEMQNPSNPALDLDKPGVNAQLAYSDNAQAEPKSGLEAQAITRGASREGSVNMDQLLELRTAVRGLRALGRLHAAAQILREHLDDHPDTSTWVYLEYMHLCELIEQREDFETIRKRYRSQFNRMAPYWQEPNSYVVSLDGYARAANELCTLWRQDKGVVRSTLSSWLIGPLLGRKLVQLPAYHDLFDLYEMLDFLDESNSVPMVTSSSATSSKKIEYGSPAENNLQNRTELPEAPELDFLPTVNLLDLDYEFSSDVTLGQHDVDQSKKAVTIVKSGHFSVDINLAGTEIGGLFSQPAELDKK